MIIEDAIIHALEGHAILFAGSGFSYGARNFDGNAFRVGNGLRDLLADECGLTTSNSLSNVAQFFKKKKSPETLIDILIKEFSVKEISKWHETLMTVNWKRIYTTNYDAVIEYAANKIGKYYQSVVVSDQIGDYKPSNVCVHLNGSVARLNISALDNEFKLTDRSYDCDLLEGKPWFEFMKSDLKSAKAIIIIGYSMQFDIDIKRLLSPPEISDKIIFINKPGLDEVETSLLQEYGECSLIGIDGFASKIEEATKSFIFPIGGPTYNSFLKEHMTPILPEDATYNDIYNLYHLGVLKPHLFTKTLFAGFEEKYKYLVLREGVNITVKRIMQKKVFLATADLGNGKTLYCELVRNELRTSDIHVFFYKTNLNELDDEIESICKIHNKRCVVIIDNYQSKLSILRRFRDFGITNITFVLTARKAVNAPNYRKLISALRIDDSEIQHIYLDKLDEAEVEQLSKVLSNESILNKEMGSTDAKGIQQYIVKNCHSRFSDLLLEIFKSTDIKDRILETYLTAAQERQEIKKIAILALLKSVMNIDIDFTDILTIMKIDYMSLSVKESEFLNEFFSVSDNDVHVKSSVIAKELLYSVVGLSDMILTMCTFVIEADKAYKANGTNKDILRNLVSHAHFIPFISRGCNVDEITGFYNSIRLTHFCSTENPYFWGQFASACIDAKNYDLANQCLETAFTVASTITHFVPFHIETIKARCVMESLLSNSTPQEPETVIQLLIECHQRLTKHFDHPENNVYYIFKVGIKYVEIFKRYKDSFTPRQKSIFTEKKVDMVRRMDNYKEQYNNLSNWMLELNSCVFL